MTKNTSLSILCALLLTTTACGDDDRATTDSGIFDSRGSDANDTGTLLEDAGAEPDSGPVDAGNDSGDVVDASLPDSGPVDSGDDASTGPKRVFVTETRYSGDLRGEFGTATGTEAADAACQAAALEAELGGTFVAWLTDPSASAASRIAGVGPWYRLDGEMVFASAAEFMTGPAMPISLTEYGVAPTVGSANVWTGTRLDGRPGPNCGEWARGDSALGGAGLYNATGSDWTDVSWPVFAGNMCDRLHRIYCFEQ